jgi:hypothetical protein
MYFRYLTAFILLWKLNSEVELFSWNIVGPGITRDLKYGWPVVLVLISTNTTPLNCHVLKTTSTS